MGTRRHSPGALIKRVIKTNPVAQITRKNLTETSNSVRGMTATISTMARFTAPLNAAKFKKTAFFRSILMSSRLMKGMSKRIQKPRKRN